jgi:glycosyltransferase involved in cell wall biosynthesis
MTNVLLLTYMFPPAGGIGTPRALAYARYLPRQNCRLSVLAPTKPALRDHDPGLDKMIPPDVVVHRAWTPELPMSFRDRIWKRGALSISGDGGSVSSARKRTAAAPFRWLAHRLLFPDPQVLWVPNAFRKACRVIEKDAIDTIIVNMPPYSLLKLALSLKREFPHLKLITDFRDEWLGYYLSQIDHPTEDKVRRAWELEAEAVHASTYVSTVTDTWVERLRRRYPGEPASKFVCTPNGYDPEMFRDFKPRRRKDDKIVITYFGTVHDNRIYSPDNYLAAVENLQAQIRNKLETRFIGRVIGDAQSLLKRTKAPVQLMGFMPKQQGIRELQDTDFLLLIATDPSSHAGKLFDYFACSKPILALSPPGGEIDRLLRLTRTGWCADPWDQNAIEEMILSACRQFKQGSAGIDPDLDVIQAYSWPQILARFAAAVRLGSAAGLGVSSAPTREFPLSVGA